MKKKLIFVLAFMLAASFLPAASMRTGDWVFMSSLKPWGINTAAGYNGISLLEERDSIFWLLLGGRASQRGYYRDLQDDNSNEEVSDYDDINYWAYNLNWGFGFSQGLIDDPRKATDLVYVSAYYKGVREWYHEQRPDQVIFNSMVNDKDGILQNSIIFELAMDNVIKEKESGMRSGFFTSLSYEYAPEAFGNDIVGNADFSKFSFNFKFFLPLHDFSDDSMFSCLYFGNSTLADYMFGDNVTLYARKNMTSLSPTASLGGLIRGYENYRFDSEFKIANRSEFRLLMKKIPLTFLHEKTYIRFSTIAFFDVGYYEILDGATGNLLCTTGVGVLGSFMDSLAVTLYIASPLTEDRLDDKKLVPVMGFNFKF